MSGHIFVQPKDSFFSLRLSIGCFILYLVKKMLFFIFNLHRYNN